MASADFFKGLPLFHARPLRGKRATLWLADSRKSKKT
jgi:hypothetical protein